MLDDTADTQPRSQRGRTPAAPGAPAPPAGGVVFDCDGVLADTNSCWDTAFRGVARDRGLALTPVQLAELHGSSLGTAAERLARWSGRPAGAADLVAELRDRLVAAIGSADLTLPAGARDLLDELYGVACLGVASNSPRAVLLNILARLEITEYFAAAVSADDVPRPKPAPDPYLAACRALGIDPAASLAIEDSEIGIRSAVAAGLTVIELTGPQLTDQHDTGNHPHAGSALQVASLADPRIRALTAGLQPGRQFQS